MTFDHYMKCVVHVKAVIFDWSLSQYSQNKQFLMVAKSQLQEVIKSVTGIKWDYLDATGKGGTITTGNIAHSLLHSKVNRDLIVSSLPAESHNVFTQFGLKLFVMICILSSKLNIYVKKYKTFCTVFHLFLIRAFERRIHKEQAGTWISITPSLHYTKL